jgi:IS1 family transposase
MEDYEDDGTWIWVSFASECRMVIAHAVGKRKQYMANKIVSKTANRLASIPLFVTDGLKFYTKAMLKVFGKVTGFAPTGKRGRPKKPRVILDENLTHAQVIKRKKNGSLIKVLKKVVFGVDIDVRQVSTSLIERLNLTIRQDNNRISRKTIGFSKKLCELDNQMTLYFANYNFCRGHGSLKELDNDQRIRKSSPAKKYGLIDHNWSLRELLTYPYYIISTC